MVLHTIGKIILLVVLLVLGYILLNEGLRFENPKEKMIKATARPLPKKELPKLYSIILGSICFFGALYLAFEMFLGF